MPRPRLFSDEERKARKNASYHARKTAMTTEERAEFLRRSNESQRRYYANHAEKAKAKAREHWAKPEIRTRRLAQQKARWESNPEHWRAYGRAARLRTIPTHIAAQKRWIDNNRPKTVLAVAKRRALKHAAPRNDLTHQQWLDIQAAQDHCCAYCEKRCKGRLTQDHITPLSEGGSHTLHNVIGACKSCNSRKGNRSILAPVQPLLL